MAVLTFFGCDDNTGTLGLGMLPDSDGMSAHTTTFNVTTRSFAVDSVFAKTSTGYIGKFSDPEFGYYETSFLTELNCTENFSLPEVYKVTERDSEGNPIKATGTMTADSVVSVQLAVYYSSWFGDSLNACRMSIYELDKKLDKIAIPISIRKSTTTSTTPSPCSDVRLIQLSIRLFRTL